MSRGNADVGRDQLATIRRRVRRLVWWSGVSLSLTALFGGLVVAGLIDWLIRLEDQGLRVLLAAVVWGLVAGTLWRTLLAPLRFALSNDLIADQVDRRYPGLSGRSRSAAEFEASGCDPRWGSAELQALVIRQSSEDLARVEPRDIVEPRRLTPRLCAAWLTCLVAGILLFAYPLEAATAVRRLVWPWGQQPWPQTTVLQLFDANGLPFVWNEDQPLQAVRGETLRFLVKSVRGPLPDEILLLTRFEPDEPPVSTVIKQEFRDTADGEQEAVGVLEIPATRGPFEFRVVGGDDRSMPWHRLSVVEPPMIADFSIKVVPPAYSGLPEQTLPPGMTQIRGLIGSQVTVAARSTKPLRSASLSQREVAAVPLPVSANEHEFVGTLTVKKPGTTVFWFVLTDRQGFREQQPLEFELRGEIDTVPEVLLSQPDSDRLVTPTAVVTLDVEARDDRGLTQMRLAWQVDESEPVARQLAAWDEQPLQASHLGEWNLSELKVQAGQRLVFRVEALDACDIGEPHVGKCPPRTLLIVSPEDKATDLAHRIGELLNDLLDAARQQARLEQQTGELETQLKTVGSLRNEDRDLLNRVQFDQRRLNAQLSDQQHGLAQRARRLRGEYSENGLSDQVSEPQLADLAQALEELSASTLPNIDQQLTQAAKLLDQSSAADQAAAGQSLANARREQAEILEVLHDRQVELGQWQDDREVTGELQSLLEAQKKLNADTADIGAETLSRAQAELTPQQSAELQKLAARQRQQAERIGQFQRQVQRLGEQLEASDPARAADAVDAAAQLEQRQLEASLRQAADDVAANRMGPAARLQQAAEQALEELAESWSEQSPSGAEQLAQRLSQMEKAVEALAERAEMLRKKSDESLTTGDREMLRKEAEELRREAQRLERQLDRLRSPSASEAARQAAQEFRKAAAAAQDADDPERLRKHVSAAKDALETLQTELRRQKNQVQARLAQEELHRIASQIESLKVRQYAVVTETIRLEDQRQATGRLTRGQLRSLQDLVGIERELSETAAALREQLAAAVVAKAALNGVVRSMERAAERLSERQTDLSTQRLEKDAAQRLSRILTAWNRKSDDGASDKTEGSGTGNDDEPQDAGPPGEAVSLQVQLALLRELQADCLDRTVEIEQLRKPDGSLPAELSPWIADVATEQGELVQLAEELIALMKQSQGPQTPAAEEQP